MKVIFELPDAVEKAGYSTATKAIMSGEKLKALGWDAKYSIQEGMHRTLVIVGLALTKNRLFNDTA